MKRRKSALIAVLTLIMAIASLHVVGLAEANYYPPPSIEIFSPISALKVYDSSSVQLYLRVNALPKESSSITFIRYCLDGKANVTLANLSREDGLYYWTTTEGVIASGNGFSVNTTLDNLAEGKHTLIVYSHAVDGIEMSRPVEFTVDYDYVPSQSTFSGYINHTATPAPTDSQSETSMPTINTGSIQPSETPNPTLLIVIAIVIVVSVLAAAPYFRRKHKVIRLDR
jgi:hypothetical protein